MKSVHYVKPTGLPIDKTVVEVINFAHEQLELLIQAALLQFVLQGAVGHLITTPWRQSNTIQQ